MNKEFIPHKPALELKELGFDEPCLKYWNGIGEYFDQKDWFNWNQVEKFVSIPLYQQAFRWFREKHQLYAWVKVEYEYGGITPTYYITGKRQGDIAGGPFNTHEEAELACLIKLIELVKKD